MFPENPVIGVVGLGYVGLPLAVELAKHYMTIGFDVDVERVSALERGEDNTREVTEAELYSSSNLKLTAKISDLTPCDVYVVAVPTPVDKHKQPDLSPMVSACELVAGRMTKGNVVVFESTVYPGATEEICVPVLEAKSGFKLNSDFYVGYSPERVNPGDKGNRLTSITKVTSGSTPEAAEFIDSIYKQIIHAGTFLASSIKVAEAAKVIENVQRDVNIALMNAMSILL